MKKVVVKLSALTLTLLLVTFFSCKKAENETKETITSAEDNTISESALSTAFDAVDDVSSTDGRTGKTGSTILPSGAVVTFTDSLFNDGDGVDYYIDFGALGSSAPKGLLCLDGRYRSGKIFISQSKRYFEVGCVVTVIMKDDATAHYVGDGSEMVKLVADVTITRTGASQVTINTANGKAVTSSGTIEFSSNKTITKTVDPGPGVWGDEYEVTGNGSGKNRNGDAYTWNITKTLTKQLNLGCARTFTKGVIELINTSSNNKLSINFDPFNNGACDRTVEITLPGGIKKTITVN